MAVPKSRKHHIAARDHILYVASKMFVKQGYEATKVLDIAREIGIGPNSVNYLFPTKEDILVELVRQVLAEQFEGDDAFLKGKTEDTVLIYAAECVLHIYLAEISMNLHYLYETVFTSSRCRNVIQDAMTEKVERLFKCQNPALPTKEYFTREIAAGAIVRNFIITPCNMWFGVKEKIRPMLESTLRVFEVPDTKIEEAIRFVRQFDYPEIAQKTLDTWLQTLKERADKSAQDVR